MYVTRKFSYFFPYPFFHFLKNPVNLRRTGSHFQNSKAVAYFSSENRLVLFLNFFIVISQHDFESIYTQSGLISTTVNVSVLVVLIFSQNFSTNGAYVVLNFCKFSDTMVLIF